MSSIIDALKKSDNNRTTDTGKNINQINFGNEIKKPSRRGFWLLVLLLLIVVFGVFAWQQGWHRSFLAQFKTEQTAPNKSGIDTTNIPAKTTPELTTSNKLTPPNADQVRAKSTATQQTKNDMAKVENSETPIISTPEQSNESLEEQLTVVNNTKEQPEKIDEKRANANPKTDIKEEDRSLEPGLKQDYLFIHQIDFEIRKNIPPIKLNIHIYDPEPENRLVMMNGVKYQVGDVIGELVTVDEINQEGVVLKFENIRFLVPK